MNRFIYLSLLLLVSGLLQPAKGQVKEPVFLQLLDANGKLVKGTSVIRGYERQIEVLHFSVVSSGNPELRFSMPSGSASSLLSAAAGEKGSFAWAVFSVTVQSPDKLQLRSTIRLEEVTVVRTQETIGGTEVTLKADRIGTTQYEWNRKTGVVTIAGKTGYDYKAGTSWNSF